ncbi:tyrosine-type recombinase/integrase [Amantichitinum ursilacus]|uniref:tyrosine-type recombinase/integrase n=1 Tax=Amantichitinum ursilacus TaxID=857265 RepID=UPI0009F8E3D4|nr:tyrosine-type recombinase/integrase [Amantichitinum ursilacus]
MQRIARDEKLANIRLPDLGPEHFADLRNRRLKEVTPNSVRREWASLSHACGIAVCEWRWLAENPMSSVERPPQAPARTRRVTLDDIERLTLATGYCAEELCVTQMARVGAALLFAIETGMRAGEICALEWHYVDFSRRLAHLPKTKNGHPRDVPLSKEALRCAHAASSSRSSMLSIGKPAMCWRMD